MASSILLLGETRKVDCVVDDGGLRCSAQIPWDCSPWRDFKCLIHRSLRTNDSAQSLIGQIKSSLGASESNY